MQTACTASQIRGIFRVFYGLLLVFRFSLLVSTLLESIRHLIRKEKRKKYFLKRKNSPGPQEIPDRSMKRNLAKDRTDLCRVFQAASRIYAAPRNRVYLAAMQPALYSVVFCTWENTIVVRGSSGSERDTACIIFVYSAQQSIQCVRLLCLETLFNRSATWSESAGEKVNEIFRNYPIGFENQKQPGVVAVTISIYYENTWKEIEKIKISWKW